MRRHKLPAVLSDIDGVLYRGARPIPGSQWATQRLVRPFATPTGEVSLPFSLLTNGGGDTETERTKLVNSRMWDAPQQAASLLKPCQMICCHTPLRKIVPKLADKFVLVTGCGNSLKVCHEYGFAKAIHAEELFALAPNAAPLAKKEYPADRQAKNRAAVLARFQKTSETELLSEIKFEAVFVMSDVWAMELNLQLIMDVLMSRDGSLGSTLRSGSEP